MSAHLSRLCLLALGIFFSTSGLGQTATEAALQSGRTWLEARVQADGRVEFEDAAIALPDQTRTETALALRALDALPLSSRDAIAASAADATESKARRALVLAVAGSADASAAGQVEAMQNSDGGYGAFVGRQSSVLDTAWALQALARSSSADAGKASRALGWLVAAKLPDDGFGENGQSDSYTTAHLLLAANAWSSRFATGALSGAARDFLLAHRDASGGFGETYMDATALLALAGVTADATIVGPLQDRLIQQQGQDGSWSSDPYQTALALRALQLITAPPTAPTTASLGARIIDDVTNAPIEGVLAQIVETPNASFVTGADGVFTLDGMAAGSATLRISRLGYERLDFALNLVAGQTLRMGDIRLRAAPLTATISGVVRDANGLALANAVVAVGTASVLTNTSGAYELSGIPSGSATIGVSLPNYRSVSQDVVLDAGRRYTFSPTLFFNSQTPPVTATLRGKVIDAQSSLPVTGANVTVAGATKVTLADGKFEFTGLGAGTFTLSISAPAYDALTVTGSVVAGVNDVGTIAMTRTPTTSTLVGSVVDAMSGAPIAGATLVVQGQTATALSGPDGRYSLSGIQGTGLTLVTTAPGFLSNTLQIGLPQVGTNTLDIPLTALQDVGIRISNVATNKPVYLPSEELELEIEVISVTAAPVEMIVSADVRNESGDVVHTFKANPQGLGDDPPNQPISFAPNSLRELELDWMLARQPAGIYTIHAIGTDSNGRVLAEGTTRFTLDAAAVLAGGVIANPPLVQVGTGTPVHLSAELTNFGNLPIPAGDVKLQVILENADTQTSTVPRVGVTQAFGGAPLNNAQDMVRGPDGDYFVLNSGDRNIIRITPQNVASIYATLPANFVGDSLAVAADGTLYAASSISRFIYRVGPDGTISAITLQRLSLVYDLDVGTDGVVVANGRFAGAESNVSVNEARLLRVDAAGVETVLWQGGMDAALTAVKDSDGTYVVTSPNDNALFKVAPSGRMTRFVGGLNRPAGIALSANGEFYVTQLGDNSLVKVSATGVITPLANGLNTPYDVKLDPQGNAFVADFGSNTIVKIAPDGSKEVFARGVAQNPVSMRYDDSGNLYVLGSDGSLRKKAPDGSVAITATGLSGPRGLAVVPDGSVLVVESGAGKVTRVADGTKTALLTGLNTPQGVALDDAGRLAITERNVSRIVLADAAGARLASESTLVQFPSRVLVGDGDDVFVASSAFVTRVRGGIGERFGAPVNFNSMAFDPLSGDLVGANGFELRRVDAGGLTTFVKPTPFFISDVAVDSSGDAVALDINGRRLVRIANDGVETVVATFASSPQGLVSDRAGNLYVKMTFNTLHRVLADGSISLLTSLAGENIRSVTATADGKLLVTVFSAKSILIDPATAVTTELPALGALANFETALADGSRVATFSSNDVVFYSPAGTETARISGFLSPNDVVWADGEFVFNDQSGNLFGWVPGSYPRKLATGFGGSALSYANNLLLGSDGNTIYRWTGSARQVLKSVSGVALSGVAVRPDGGFAGSDISFSRVMEFDAAANRVADFAGIVGPISIAFAPDGGLLVANANGATIVKIDRAGSAAQTVASISGPEYLAFDPTGELWVTRSNSVSRVRSDGVVVTQSSGISLHGLLFDGPTPIAMGRVDGTIRRWNGSQWLPIASSLTRGPLTLDANGHPLIASEGNRTLSRFQDGGLAVIVSGIPFQPLGMSSVPSGDVIITGLNGSAASVDDQGALHDLRFQPLVANAPIYASVFDTLSSGRVLLNEHSVETQRLFDIRVTQAPVPPAVGTVVHEVHRPMSVAPVAEEYASIDFGDWLPAFGGDFKVVVGRDDVSGSSANFVHVGPSAQAALSAAQQTLPPGDQSLHMCLDLSGADFTTLSRVEISRIRPLVSNTRPNGMVADRAGNLYYTTSNSLNRTAVDGTSTTLVSGLNPAFGLAIDDGEVLYFPNRNTATGKFELMRADLAGSATLFAPLNVSTANGVAVDSFGNVLVGTAGKLLKVSPSGVLTVIGTPGLPSPRGITIDGDDNIYVQNENALVSMVNPDGSTFVLFSGGDGVENPSFEGDGFPNITADCASNVYIAPFWWEKIGQLASEEHILAQIIPRTGQAGALFDGRRVSSELTDIDYLSYDRFGDRILMWQDFSSRIWQAPVTCGAIGVEAHLTTLPGQVLSGMSRGPSAVVDLPGGSKEYVWSLRDVTAAGEAVCFDAPQSDLQLGELRQTLASGFMEFQNSFAPDNVRVPIAVPSIRVDDLVAITVATDRAEYRANERVAITTGLLNSNVEPVSAALSVRVLDAHGAQVALVATQGVDLPATGQTSAAHEFAVANLLPGQYRVVSELSQADRLVASASVDFMVLADDAPSSVSSRLATDKQVYDAGERVTILSRASNLSANVVRENLTLRIVVLDAGGATLTTYSHFVSQLLPGASRDFSQAQQLGNVPAGAYRVEQQLLDADNRVLDFQAAAYQVRSGAESGVGVAGAVDATPNDVLSGAVATLNATIRNDGNVAIAALPVQVAVIDVQTQSVLASWPETLDLGLGAQRSLVHDWNSARVPAGEYLAVLTASFGGVDRVLAQDTLQVAKPDVFAVVSGTIVVAPETPMVGESVQLDAAVRNAGSVPLFDLPVRVQVMSADGTEVASWSRIVDIDVAASATIQNLWDSTDAVEAEYRVRLSLEIDGALHTLGEQAFTMLPASDPVKVETSLTRSSAARVLVLVTCHDDESEPDDRGNASNDDDDCDDEDEDGCAASRATFLDSYLTDAGVAHRIVTSTDDFETLFRSGRYNVYWISGGGEKLENVLAEEVREAVFRGDGLIVDGNHDSRNKILDEALGVKHVGQLAHNDHSVVVGGSVFANITFVGRGDAMRYELQGGSTHATFDSASGSPALVSNAYGRGHALGFAFGLASTLMHDSASSDLRRLLLTSVGLVSPAVDVADPAGGFVALDVELRNVGSEADVDLVLTVDAPVAIESTDPSADTANATTAVWKIHVIEGERRLVVAGVRLPSTQGLATVRLTALRRDTDEVLAESELQISARDMRAVRDDLVHDLSALAVSSGKERSARDNALTSIAHAVDAAETGRWDAAFEDLLKARDQLVRITSVSIAQPRTDVARLLRAVELRWFAAGASSHPDD